MVNVVKTNMQYAKKENLLLMQSRWKAVSLKLRRSEVSAYSKKRQPLSQSPIKSVS